MFRIEEAKKRDHRKLGKELGLFMFHEYAPGAPFLASQKANIFIKNSLGVCVTYWWIRVAM